MPHRTKAARALRAAAVALAALLPASCASTGDSTPSPSSSPDSPGGEPGAAPVTAPASSGKGVVVGWMEYRGAKKAGQVTSLTLIGASTEAGRLITAGRARMDGGKVVDDRTAGLLAQSFDEEGFGRFAVKCSPNEPVPGAMQCVWMDRGNGFESLFFLPGQRQNAATRDLPDVFDHLKKLVFSVHQATPGSMVVTGEGWSGDSMLNQKPGDGGR